MTVSILTFDPLAKLSLHFERENQAPRYVLGRRRPRPGAVRRLICWLPTDEEKPQCLRDSPDPYAGQTRGKCPRERIVIQHESVYPRV